MMAGGYALALPQRAWVSRDKVVKLALVLRKRRYGHAQPDIAWRNLDPLDREYWIGLAVQHLVDCGIVVPIPRRATLPSAS